MSYHQNWHQTQVFYSIETNRIEFIYLICETHEDAKKVMLDRVWFTQKLKRYNVKISALPTDILRAPEYYTESYAKPENCCMIIKPPGSLEVIEELPEGPILLTQVQQLIKIITQLEDNQVNAL